jgi:hypothetical protein
VSIGKVIEFSSSLLVFFSTNAAVCGSQRSRSAIRDDDELDMELTSI